MAKHNQPLWYFIDFENTSSLGNIVPKANDKILLFLGVAQKALPVPLVQQLMDMPCEVELISVQGQSANNVDFHLSYYLGLYQTSAPKTAKFVVVSKDKGYDHLVQRVNSEIRVCVKNVNA